MKTRNKLGEPEQEEYVFRHLCCHASVLPTLPTGESCRTRMKVRMSTRRYLVPLLSALLLASVAFPSQASVGLGAQIFGSIPVVTGSLGFSNMVADLGLGFQNSGTVGMSFGMLWYCADLKYRVPLAEKLLYVYAGGGAIGVSANATLAYGDITASASGTALGAVIVGGLEVSFARYHVPLSLLGGLDWISVSSLALNVGGATTSIPLGISGLGWHVGVRWDF